MHGFGDILALAYIVLLLSMMGYWPLQLLALVVVRGNDRLVGMGILAFTLLVFASFDGGVDGPNFPPVHVVLLVSLANLALVGLMLRSLLGRRSEGERT